MSMNARTLAAVAVRVSALIGLAGVLASCPMTAFFSAIPYGANPTTAALRFGQIEMLITLIVRAVVVVVLFVAGGRIASAITKRPLEALRPDTGISWRSLTALALGLTAVYLFVEGVETLTGPLYLLATKRVAAMGTVSSPELWAKQREIVVKSIVTLAAAAAIFWRHRLGRSLKPKA
jgi:hypothetical protein